ncbi:MAG TPA: hypothetical protein VLZ50_10540 [Terracidiphilus sp.]|nr:hypothetical protein [Terracidiphilus sp.]
MGKGAPLRWAHYHACMDADVRRLVEHTRTAMRLRWEPAVFWKAHFYRKECVLMLRRTA